MTNKEAINILLEGLPDLRMRPKERQEAYNKYQIALYMAISALKFQDKVKEACCSSCGFELESYIREEVKND